MYNNIYKGNPQQPQREYVLQQPAMNEVPPSGEKKQPTYGDYSNTMVPGQPQIGYIAQGDTNMEYRSIPYYPNAYPYQMVYDPRVLYQPGVQGCISMQTQDANGKTKRMGGQPMGDPKSYVNMGGIPAQYQYMQTIPVNAAYQYIQQPYAQYQIQNPNAIMAQQKMMGYGVNPPQVKRDTSTNAIYVSSDKYSKKPALSMQQRLQSPQIANVNATQPYQGAMMNGVKMQPGNMVAIQQKPAQVNGRAPTQTSYMRMPGDSSSQLNDMERMVANILVGMKGGSVQQTQAQAQAQAPSTAQAPQNLTPSPAFIQATLSDGKPAPNGSQPLNIIPSQYSFNPTQTSSDPPTIPAPPASIIPTISNPIPCNGSSANGKSREMKDPQSTSDCLKTEETMPEEKAEKKAMSGIIPMLDADQIMYSRLHPIHRNRDISAEVADKSQERETNPPASGKPVDEPIIVKKEEDIKEVKEEEPITEVKKEEDVKEENPKPIIVQPISIVKEEEGEEEEGIPLISTSETVLK